MSSDFWRKSEMISSILPQKSRYGPPFLQNKIRRPLVVVNEGKMKSSAPFYKFGLMEFLWISVMHHPVKSLEDPEHYLDEADDWEASK